MTAHIEANIEDIAEIVIMPGDPLRAKFIAETYLKDIKLVNQVRGIYAYTGLYNNKKITVMASGMGMPSIGIYSYELFKFYNVNTIIRIGTAGSYDKDLNVKDLLLVDTSYSDSSFAYVQNGYLLDHISANKNINEKIEETAYKLNIPLKKGNIYSSDVFYNDKESNIVKKYELKATEMESYALFHNAKILNKKAACILTISNSFITNEEMTPLERQTSLDKMFTLALNTASNL